MSSGRTPKAPIKYLPWSEDHWLSQQGSVLKWDKPEHFLLGLLGTTLIPQIISYLHVLSGHEHVVIALTALLFTFIGFLWERRDGKRAYNDAGNIQGFSWKDIIVNQAGILLGYAVNVFWLYQEVL